VELHIQSPYLKQALREVIGAYPGITLHTAKMIAIKEPPMCLFHYRRELQTYLEASSEPTMRSHLKLLLGYTEKTLEREIRHYDDAFEGRALEASLEHEHLWMGYRPGELLYTVMDGVECVARMLSISKVMKLARLLRSEEIDHWRITVERIEFEGQGMIRIPYRLNIGQYDGCLRLNQQLIYPLRFHPEAERVRKELSDRGRRYQKLAGVFHRYYDGPAKLFDPQGLSIPTLHTNVGSKVLPSPYATMLLAFR